MTNNYNNNQENKLSSPINLGRLGVLKQCDFCGVSVILKKREVYEIQYPCNWLLCKKVLVESRWEAFDVHDVNQRHNCNERQQQETLEQWT